MNSVDIDKLKSATLTELVGEYHRLGIYKQIDYDKFYLYSIITHSTAIEGSTVTELENQLLFDEGITAKGRTLQEQMMNLDLRNAYEWGMTEIKHHPEITPDFLCTLASKVMARTGAEYNTLAGKFSAARGDIRLLNVTAGFGGKSYMNYTKVPLYLGRFCEELNLRRKALDATDVQAVYELSFWAHYELVTIHPWADGNGRTTRLLTNLLQMEYGVLPTRVLKEEKGEYIQALIDSREHEDTSIFVSFMSQLEGRHLCDEIKQFLASMEADNLQPTDMNVAEELTERQRLILSVLNDVAVNVAVNTKYLSERLCVNRKTIQRETSLLRAKHLIQWVGSDKTGHWELVAKK